MLGVIKLKATISGCHYAEGCNAGCHYVLRIAILGVIMLSVTMLGVYTEGHNAGCHSYSLQVLAKLFPAANALAYYRKVVNSL
jgi:hypothetical protein